MHVFLLTWLVRKMSGSLDGLVSARLPTQLSELLALGFVTCSYLEPAGKNRFGFGGGA